MCKKCKNPPIACCARPQGSRSRSWSPSGVRKDLRRTGRRPESGRPHGMVPPVDTPKSLAGIRLLAERRQKRPVPALEQRGCPSAAAHHRLGEVHAAGHRIPNGIGRSPVAPAAQFGDDVERATDLGDCAYLKELRSAMQRPVEQAEVGHGVPGHDDVSHRSQRDAGLRPPRHHSPRTTILRGDSVTRLPRKTASAGGHTMGMQYLSRPVSPVPRHRAPKAAVGTGADDGCAGYARTRVRRHSHPSHRDGS